MYYFAKDDSMSGDRIIQGDLLVVETRPKGGAPDDIFLVKVSSKKMVRRVIQAESNFILIPSNESYEKVVCDRIEIIGVITKILIFSR